jgi:hypothetical protein
LDLRIVVVVVVVVVIVVAAAAVVVVVDRLCSLVVRVPGYRSRGCRFDSRYYEIF